jgi:hypothetical protein
MHHLRPRRITQTIDAGHEQPISQLVTVIPDRGARMESTSFKFVREMAAEFNSSWARAILARDWSG